MVAGLDYHGPVSSKQWRFFTISWDPLQVQHVNKDRYLLFGAYIDPMEKESVDCRDSSHCCFMVLHTQLFRYADLCTLGENGDAAGLIQFQQMYGRSIFSHLAAENKHFFCDQAQRNSSREPEAEVEVPQPGQVLQILSLWENSRSHLRHLCAFNI